MRTAYFQDKIADVQMRNYKEQIQLYNSGAINSKTLNKSNQIKSNQIKSNILLDKAQIAYICLIYNKDMAKSLDWSRLYFNKLQKKRAVL